LNLAIQPANGSLLLGRTVGQDHNSQTDQPHLDCEQGEVRVDGALPLHGRDPSYAGRLRPSGSGAFSPLSVQENVALIPKLEGWHRTKIKTRVRKSAYVAFRRPICGQYPDQLQAGKDSVWSGKCYGCRSAGLLMDEPFGPWTITRAELQQDSWN